jgi:Uma2 family endonuclease
MRSEAKKLFTVDEYYQMAGIGILSDGDRTELINGEVIEMPSMNARHAAAVQGANQLLVPLFSGKAEVRVQLPVRLNRFNEPQPDICLVKPQLHVYRRRHPQPEDVFLVLEISDTSLRYDRDVKLPLYAASGIPEVWIADLEMESLLAFRDPSGEHYQTCPEFREGSLTPLSFPDVIVELADLLGFSRSN